MAEVEAAAEGALRHREARITPEVGKRIIMSRRLLRWLAAASAPTVTPRSFAEAAIDYAATGAWVDRARTALRGGEAAAIISEAYEELLERAQAEREKENQRFGRLLIEWNHGAPRRGAVIPIEAVLGEIVAPLAAAVPILMVVFDGLSLAVFYELIDSLTRNWTVLARMAGTRKESQAVSLAIAALPSITEVSRASLLSGAIVRGNSQVEKTGFAANQFLLDASRPRHPPRLFHKGELTAAGGTELAPEVREAIAERDLHVVGVVFNAVDDHLSGPEQVRPQWDLGYLSQQLKGLLDEAAGAGRVVVIASDHGHVLDADTELRRAQDGDRWRSAEGEAGEGEWLIEGGRLAPGLGKIIAPWSERIRYGNRKNGYHGGITPQEMVAPVCVLRWAGMRTDIGGWTETLIGSPPWWLESGVPAKETIQRTLFARAEEPSETPQWLGTLLKSRTYKSQKEMLGRGAPSDSEIRELLEALNSRGGKLTMAALAQRLRVPPLRVIGKVAAARRLLNLEGYAVLSHDYVSDTVELDVPPLRKQFEV